ncbi:lipopolysaccharide assembly protein LapB [Halobacteriovorax sp. HLS]|uniref:tetratricopeptide repeat protein n=1 Tax=Halobacteriovorax sp. HLS TaxID=2234000 RepID=UPI000FD9BB18|nr:tetratricopeptide repeat protein [Halobacteriovorax sp. HLS]
MKFICVLAILSIMTSCGSHRINNSQKSKSDTFSDETFMRYGHARLDKLDKLNPLESALANCYKGKFNSGLSSLKKSLNANRSNSKYWLYLGNCYNLYGSTHKANYYYDFALSGPKEVQAAILNNRALLAMKGLNYNEANELLQKAIKLAPGVKVPKYNLAQLYIKFNHTQSARDLLREYQSSSTDKDVIFSMMSIELIEGNLKEAKKWEEKFSNNDLRREDISLYRSLLYFEMKEFKKAKDALGLQRPTIIEEIKAASIELQDRINSELKRIQEELDSKDAKVRKGVNSVAVKN